MHLQGPDEEEPRRRASAAVDEPVEGGAEGRSLEDLDAAPGAGGEESPDAGAPARRSSEERP